MTAGAMLTHLRKPFDTSGKSGARHHHRGACDRWGPCQTPSKPEQSSFTSLEEFAEERRRFIRDAGDLVLCRAMPRFFAIASAAATTPRAIRPWPPSFSLANTKTVSPSAICLPPYIVFCAVNANVFARGSQTSALIANVMLRARLRAGANG